MSKKSRRARAKSRSEQQIPSDSPAFKQEVTLPVAQTGSTNYSPNIRNTLTQDLRYKHVIPELYRIAIFAGALFVILIVIAIITG